MTCSNQTSCQVLTTFTKDTYFIEMESIYSQLRERTKRYKCKFDFYFYSTYFIEANIWVIKNYTRVIYQ